MEKQEFAIFASAVRTYYPDKNFLPNNEAMALWYREVQDIPFPVIEAGLRKWVATNKWPPTIADIREMASEVTAGDIPDWGTGWHQVCEAMRKFGREYPKRSYASMHPLVAEAAQQLGNWWDLCVSGNLEADRANFRMIYESLAKKEKADRQLALPLQEQIKQLQGNSGLLSIGTGE